MSQHNVSTHSPFNLSYQRILAIAAPVLVANLAMPLQGAIDIAIVGHFPKPYHLAGLGIASQLWLLILVSFNFLQYASSGLSAQALGRQDSTGKFNQELGNILFRSLGLSIILAVILWLLKPLIISVGLNLLGANSNSSNAANAYLQTRYLGIVLELMNYAFIGWFAGQGKTKQMMFVQILISSVNILFTLTFVYIFDMGLQGVALGTVIGYLLGCTVAFMLAYNVLKNHRKQFTTPTKKINSENISTGNVNNKTLKQKLIEIYSWDKMLSLFSLNKDIFIRTILLTLSFAWITRLSALQGDLIMATNAILLQVLSISAFALDGVAVAAESLSGQAAARNNRQQFYLAVKKTGIITFWLALSLSAIWSLVLPIFLDLMTDLESVFSLVMEYRYVAALLPIVGAGAYWLDGIMFGLTAGKTIRQVAIIVSLIFFPLSYILYESFGSTHGMKVIWASIYWLLLSRFIIAAILLWRNQSKLIYQRE